MTQAVFFFLRIFFGGVYEQFVFINKCWSLIFCSSSKVWRRKSVEIKSCLSSQTQCDLRLCFVGHSVNSVIWIFLYQVSKVHNEKSSDSSASIYKSITKRKWAIFTPICSVCSECLANAFIFHFINKRTNILLSMFSFGMMLYIMTIATMW